MNITEIGLWLKNRYDAKIISYTECFIIQAICKENLFFDLSDRQSAVFLMYSEEIPANGLPENGNYIIIGSGITNDRHHSNCITINQPINKQILCSELNSCIAKKAKTNHQLARLNQYLLSDNFMERLMDYFFELFQNPIVYVDYSHHVVSSRQQESLGIEEWDNAVKYGRHDPQMIDDSFQFYVDEVLRNHSPYQTKLSEFDYYVWTIKNDTALYGFFVMVATKRPMPPEDLHIINTAADLAALKLGNNNDVSGKGDYSEILKDLLSDTIKTEHELAFRMLTRTWKRSDCYQLFLIDLHGKGEKYIQYVKNGIEAVSHKIKLITFEEFEVILLEDFSSNNDLTKIMDYITRSRLMSGLSDAFKSLIDIRPYYEQAKKAIIFGGQYGGEKEFIFKYSDYRFYDFLNECANLLDCKKYYHPVTADLELYDVEHKTEFFETLLTYLECGRSIQKTCKKMYLHKNTVNYRIQRIKELFNIDYDNGQEVLFIYLSLKLYSINR